MRKSPILTIAIALGLTGWSLAMLFGEEGSHEPASTLRVAQIMSADGEGFAQADRVRSFAFPSDHGPHPDYRTEWWYFTGNVTTREGRAFGYQLTFFRTALTARPEPRDSKWGASQIYMAHLAVSDVEGERLHAFERFSRGALGLAGARPEPFRVWLEDWSAMSDGSDFLPMRLAAREGGVAFELELAEATPRVLQGNRGLSAKSRDEEHASYYYSYTRMTTRGTIQIGDDAFEVEGSSWLDREWGSSALGRDQVGWDWFAIQLDDGSDLMVAQVRERAGAAPFQGGSIVDSSGRIETIEGDAIELEVLDHWQSPLTRADYPNRWRIAIPSRELELEITPAFAAQELPLSISYWEGATRIEGAREGRAVAGVGYTELTGYADEARRSQPR